MKVSNTLLTIVITRQRLRGNSSCSIASECLVNVQWLCMRNHDQSFVTYVQWRSRAGLIVVVNYQWGE